MKTLLEKSTQSRGILLARTRVPHITVTPDAEECSKPVSSSRASAVGSLRLLIGCRKPTYRTNPADRDRRIGASMLRAIEVGDMSSLAPSRWPATSPGRNHAEAYFICAITPPPYLQSKKWRSSSDRRAFAAGTRNVTPSPGVSHTSMNPFFMMGFGSPSTMSYHHSGCPTGYSKPM